MSNSTVKKFQCDYTWTIEKFETHYGGVLEYDTDEYVAKSPQFSAVDCKLKWFLELRTQTVSVPNFTTRLFLEVANKAEFNASGPISCKCEWSLINAEGQKLNTNSKYFRLHLAEYYSQIKRFPVDVPSLYKTGCIHEDKLIIHCQVSYTRESQVNYFSIVDQPDPFKEDLEKLLNNEDFSDVTVYVGDKKFPCHKNILAARCSVFKAMLTHDMKENNSNRIDISDIDENVFQKVLRYIYTGKVEITQTTVLELLHAADKYDLATLKTMCENKLSETLTKENSVKILSVAIMYNLEKLKSQATEFIQKNLKKIRSTDAWKELISQPDLMKIVLDAFTK